MSLSADRAKLVRLFSTLGGVKTKSHLIKRKHYRFSHIRPFERFGDSRYFYGDRRAADVPETVCQQNHRGTSFGSSEQKTHGNKRLTGTKDSRKLVSVQIELLCRANGNGRIADSLYAERSNRLHEWPRRYLKGETPAINDRYG